MVSYESKVDIFHHSEGFIMKRYCSFPPTLTVILFLGITFLHGCDEPGNNDLGSVTPATIGTKYREMASVVAASMDQPQYFHDGTWHLHYGDGLMFGPSYDLATHELTGSQRHLDRAMACLNSNRMLVDEAYRNIFAAFDNLESILMALQGLLESGQFIQVPEYGESAGNLVGVVDALARQYGDYLPSDLGDFAGVTYGPTSISSTIALLKLGQIFGASEEQIPGLLDRVDEVLEHIHAIAWSEALGAYRFAPGDDRLMLYPNATMMVALGRAYHFKDTPLYRQRIGRIYDGIQPLRAVSGDHYYSPYSREEAQAVDIDYATLSSQNYLMIALWYAWLGTGEAKYLSDIDKILGWIQSHLFIDGVLKHHWVNGRAANEEDLYDFCQGCNIQTLYLLRTLELWSQAGY